MLTVAIAMFADDRDRISSRNAVHAAQREIFKIRVRDIFVFPSMCLIVLPPHRFADLRIAASDNLLYEMYTLPAYYRENVVNKGQLAIMLLTHRFSLESVSDHSVSH